MTKLLFSPEERWRRRRSLLLSGKNIEKHGLTIRDDALPRLNSLLGFGLEGLSETGRSLFDVTFLTSGEIPGYRVVGKHTWMTILFNIPAKPTISGAFVEGLFTRLNVESRANKKEFPRALSISAGQR